MNRDALRGTIRSQLLAGVLPLGAARKVFGGPGDGEPCDCCGQMIERHEIGYDADISSQNGAAGLRLVAHRECFIIWSSEASELREARSNGPDKNDTLLGAVASQK